jgi:hypothetical protein
MFYSPGVVFGGIEGVGSFFLFCAPRLIFGGAEGVGSRFHVLCALTHFRRSRGSLIPFSCFPLPVMFLAVWWVSGFVFMFCAPLHVFGCPEGVVSRFHVLCSQSRFRRYRGCWVRFSCFAHPDSFPAVPRASGLVFMFCAPKLIFGGVECVGSRFHVLRSRERF